MNDLAHFAGCILPLRDRQVKSFGELSIEYWQRRHEAGSPTVRLCAAKQFSDEMACPCGNVWDVNDRYPPQCKQ